MTSRVNSIKITVRGNRCPAISTECVDTLAGCEHRTSLVPADVGISYRCYIIGSYSNAN
jgi:hypothetical protein